IMAVSCILFLQLAQAKTRESDELFVADSAQAVSNEAVREITSQLMAPCCWSMTADMHGSEAAQNIRAQVREALAQGHAEEKILNAFIAMYGERILAKPTREGFNLLGWILPAVALTVGGLVLWRFLRRHAKIEIKPLPASDSNDPYVQRLEQELKEFDR
ncbi:MAG: cytochrome c-type biogenesis protein, partial [bacterium]